MRDAEFMRGCVQADFVFHLAGLIAIPYSYMAPRSYVETNVIGTLNVLEACKQSNRFQVDTSTSEVYGSAQIIPIPESHPLVGQSPYAATKIGADKLVESYALSFEMPVVIARPFNTLGPRQTSRAVIPTIISQVIQKPKVIRLGSLEPTRDFNYVVNTVEGMQILACLEKGQGEVFNIGSNEERSIGEVAQLIFDIVGHYPKYQ